MKRSWVQKGNTLYEIFSQPIYYYFYYLTVPKNVLTLCNMKGSDIKYWISLKALFFITPGELVLPKWLITVKEFYGYEENSRTNFQIHISRYFSTIKSFAEYSISIISIFLFQLTLTSHVSNEDFQLGYSMSGHVERSFEKYISFQITHLAFVRRRDFQSIQLFVYNWFSCLFTFWFAFVYR